MSSWRLNSQARPTGNCRFFSQNVSKSTAFYQHRTGHRDRAHNADDPVPLKWCYKAGRVLSKSASLDPLVRLEVLQTSSTTTDVTFPRYQPLFQLHQVVLMRRLLLSKARLRWQADASVVAGVPVAFSFVVVFSLQLAQQSRSCHHSCSISKVAQDFYTALFPVFWTDWPRLQVEISK